MSEKLSTSLCNTKAGDFWQRVKAMKSSRSSLPPTVDGISCEEGIATNFCTKFSDLLNNDNLNQRDTISDKILQLTTSPDLANEVITDSLVHEALLCLGKDKSDDSGLSSNHLILAASVLSTPLAYLFTAILRHGYMSAALRDCTLVPIPKPNKDSTVSDNYRPIALAPNLSKVLEKCILLKYPTCFKTSDMQFGFKSGFSTELCTGVVKSVITRYLHNETNVFGCFLDASKAFDRVNHAHLFDILLKRGLPCTVLRLLMHWYKDQSLSIRWNTCYSQPFSVSNGVRQGGVLSPILFTVYLDELFARLSNLGVGCHFGNTFVGGLGYADDIVLLAPSPSALRMLLRECEVFALQFGLTFNAAKTQLICFQRAKMKTFPPTGVFTFFGTHLTFSERVNHLGHMLHYTLDDSKDICRASSDLCRKANYLLHVFSKCSPLVKTKIIASHCLSLYGCMSWKISNKHIKALEVTLNNVLRKIWKLPRSCHTGILHCVAGIESVYNQIIHRSRRFIERATKSESPLLRTVFQWSVEHMYTVHGFNLAHNTSYARLYTDTDKQCGDYIRDIRRGLLTFESLDVMKTVVYSICCD